MKQIKELKKIYSRTKKFELKDILSLTYQDDEKTLLDRIQKYWSAGAQKLENNISTALVKQYLINMYDMLLTNETLIVRNQVMHNKLSSVANILVIEGEGDDHCGGLCAQWIGEYPADEPIPLPPYHPSCLCSCYYIETDDFDDMQDLDLEMEQ